MSCAAIQTGGHFLGAVLRQIDCQAQTIGAFGYGALADPGSPVAGLLLGLLTLFIALFGIRLMFGGAPTGQDMIGDVIKIGIVLTLATSWPAWRTVAYDVVLEGPAQLAEAIGLASGLPGARGELAGRLDQADQGIVALTAFGTGRLTGGVVGSTDLGDSARGIALADQAGFSWGRVAFLVGTIGPLALVRLGAGILLALAPLMAGLLLFGGTRDIFHGWLRALAACALGALALSLVYGVELGLLEGWLQDALRQRQANVLAVAAPTELLVTALAFAAIAWGTLALIARVVFFASPTFQRTSQLLTASDWRQPAVAASSASFGNSSTAEPHRAQRVADAVAETMRREERRGEFVRQASYAQLTGPRDANRGAPGGTAAGDALGSSYRRNYRRQSAGAAKRDAAP